MLIYCGKKCLKFQIGNILKPITSWMPCDSNGFVDNLQRPYMKNTFIEIRGNINVVHHI